MFYLTTHSAHFISGYMYEGIDIVLLNKTFPSFLPGSVRNRRKFI